MSAAPEPPPAPPADSPAPVVGGSEAVVPEMVIVSGMSGAGRTTAAHCLEDLGWYVVDNLPPALLPRLADLGTRTSGAVPRIATVVDTRSLTVFADLQLALEELGRLGIDPRIVFLEANDGSLVRRFESNRRPHPLQEQEGILDGIGRERTLLAGLRAAADVVIDTSRLNVHQLTAKITAAFTKEVTPTLRATVMSFGYKYGLPVDADLVVDCRFLPNPHWVPELRQQNGRDAPVRDYVLGQPDAGEFLDAYERVLHLVTDGYAREGKRYATIAVGCTGGKHRSVAIAEELTRRLAGENVDVSVVHRDLGRE